MLHSESRSLILSADCAGCTMRLSVGTNAERGCSQSARYLAFNNATRQCTTETLPVSETSTASGAPSYVRLNYGAAEAARSNETSFDASGSCPMPQAIGHFPHSRFPSTKLHGNETDESGVNSKADDEVSETSAFEAANGSQDLLRQRRKQRIRRLTTVSSSNNEASEPEKPQKEVSFCPDGDLLLFDPHSSAARVARQMCAARASSSFTTIWDMTKLRQDQAMRLGKPPQTSERMPSPDIQSVYLRSESSGNADSLSEDSYSGFTCFVATEKLEAPPAVCFRRHDSDVEKWRKLMMTNKTIKTNSANGARKVHKTFEAPWPDNGTGYSTGAALLWDHTSAEVSPCRRFTRSSCDWWAWRSSFHSDAGHHDRFGGRKRCASLPAASSGKSSDYATYEIKVVEADQAEPFSWRNCRASNVSAPDLPAKSLVEQEMTDSRIKLPMRLLSPSPRFSTPTNQSSCNMRQMTTELERRDLLNASGYQRHQALLAQQLAISSPARQIVRCAEKGPFDKVVSNKASSVGLWRGDKDSREPPRRVISITEASVSANVVLKRPSLNVKCLSDAHLRSAVERDKYGELTEPSQGPPKTKRRRIARRRGRRRLICRGRRVTLGDCSSCELYKLVPSVIRKPLKIKIGMLGMSDKTTTTHGVDLGRLDLRDALQATRKERRANSAVDGPHCLCSDAETSHRRRREDLEKRQQSETQEEVGTRRRSWLYATSYTHPREEQEFDEEELWSYLESIQPPIDDVEDCFSHRSS